MQNHKVLHFSFILSNFLTSFCKYINEGELLYFQIFSIFDTKVSKTKKINIIICIIFSKV